MSPGTKRAASITADTMIPLSALIVVVGVIYWATSLAATVASHGDLIDGIGEHGIIGQKAIVERLDAQAATISEIREKVASTDAKMTLLIRWSESKKPKEGEY